MTFIPPLNALFNDPSRTKKGREYYTGKLLCLDPGETTGYTVFEGKGANTPILLEAGQIATKTVELGYANLSEAFIRIKPDHVVFENYLVYSWKAQEHSFQELVTPQIISVIKVLCTMQRIKYDTQMAGQAKGFVDDDKLRFWGFWHKGKRHARDATRHGIYWLLFTHFSREIVTPNEGI